MALATRCPDCQALFRVVAEQLKLRGGLVRCGSCRHVFDAIGSLSYIDDVTIPAGARGTAAVGAAAGAGANAAENDGTTLTRPTRMSQAGKHGPLTLRLTPSSRKAAATDQAEDPAASAAGVPTLIAPNLDALPRRPSARKEHGAEADAEQAERAERRERRSRRKEALAARAAEEAAPDTGAGAAGRPSPPEFLRSKHDKRGFSILFTFGSAALLLMLLGQLMVLFRTDMITHWPATRPMLVKLCDMAGCSVGWPTRAELLAPLGTELQAIPNTDVLELTAVIRNRAPFRVALPAIEVTLTDSAGRMVARKVFAPIDYLASSGEPSSRIGEGVGAGTDYSVRLFFEARGLNVSGFQIYPFYL